MNFVYVDLLVFKDFIKSMFKANMTKKTRKKKNQELMKNEYETVFDRVLLEAETIRHRKTKTKKANDIREKKATNEAKKLAVVVKQLNDKKAQEIARQKKIAAAIKKIEEDVIRTTTRQQKKKTTTKKRQIETKEIADRKKNERK